MAIQNAQCLVITGMHRSGTSVAAQAFFRAGLYLGDNLMGPSRSNPEGLFEDRDFVAFHDEILAFNRTSWHSPEGLRGLSLPASARARATNLLQRKFRDRSPAGWKDPRTSLFLDFWAGVTPRARWVFVFRDPTLVAWSLMVRGDLKVYSLNPLVRALIALRLWTIYNSRVLDFARRRPDLTLLIRAPDDFSPANERRINELLLDRWSLPLRPVAFSEVYAPHLLKKAAPWWLTMLTRLHGPARLTLRQLDRLHDQMTGGDLGLKRPRGEATAPPEHVERSARVVCVVTPRKGAYSETFVEAHIRRLPATVKAVYGAPPEFTSDGRRLLSLPARVVRLFLRRVLGTGGPRLDEAAFRNYLRKEKVDAVLPLTSPCWPSARPSRRSPTPG